MLLLIKLRVCNCTHRFTNTFKIYIYIYIWIKSLLLQSKSCRLQSIASYNPSHISFLHPSYTVTIIAQHVPIYAIIWIVILKTLSCTTGRANRPIHRFLVGWLQPCLQGTNVCIVTPQPYPSHSLFDHSTSRSKERASLYIRFYFQACIPLQHSKMNNAIFFYFMSKQAIIYALPIQHVGYN